MYKMSEAGFPVTVVSTKTRTLPLLFDKLEKGTLLQSQIGQIRFL